GLMFEFGKPTTPKQVTESQQPVSELAIDDYRVFFREDTANLTTIDDATSGLGEIMTDDEVVAEDEAVQLGLFDDTRAVAAERGTHLHSIMADIVTVDDIDAVVSRAAMRYGLTDEDRRSYHDIVSNAFAGARRHVSRWFSPEATVYKEQSIYLPERDATFRPDRIVVSPDGDVEVVDYKFTAEPLPSHRRQVEVYIALLRAMGFNSVKGYLWYPELNIVKQVK
ncbi:MAG: CRISPR-associated protein Cas4, partial [Muribaculaceae bacterium]|nr:CRISPR-associated protein Cas4 [Muribaculaceae bacterium]